MATQVLAMYATGTGGTEDNAAQMDIPEDGTIESIQVAHSAALNADAEAATAELSFITANQYAQNDSRATIVVSRLRNGLLTSGGGNSAVTFAVPMNLDVSGGERLYIHLLGTAGVNQDVNFLIHFNPRGGVRRRSRRRT